MFNTLRQRNPALYYFGWLCWLGAVGCGFGISLSDGLVMGVNAWVKPFKFFLSVAIACWSLGWMLSYLERPRAVRHFTIAAIITLCIELVIITGQAARGRQSHFNVATAWEMHLFEFMGLSILVFTLWTAVLTVHLFRKKDLHIPPSYAWGIRLGLLSFVLYALEGGAMGAILRHSIGGSDSNAGLPLLNWSRTHGDLRIAHFLGLHALQILPLFGWLLRRKRMFWFWLGSALYLGFTLFMLLTAIFDIALGGML